jgi:DNA-binding transcriptional LysR family regulator
MRGHGSGMDRVLAARPHPDGEPAPLGPMLVDTFEDKLEVVADGPAVAIAPANDRRSTLRDDLAVVPVEGIEPCQVVVATRAGDRNPLVARFRESAQLALTRVRSCPECR